MAAEAPTLFIQRVARLDAAAADIDAWRRADTQTRRESSATGDVGSAGDFDNYDSNEDGDRGGGSDDGGDCYHDHRRAISGITGGDVNMPARSDDGDSGERDGRDDGAACAVDEGVGARGATRDGAVMAEARGTSATRREAFSAGPAAWKVEAHTEQVMSSGSVRLHWRPYCRWNEARPMNISLKL